MEALTKASVRLLPLKAITGMITNIGKMGSEYSKLVHECTIQCILHAEKHHNVTPAIQLVQTIKDTNKGYVVAGIVKMFNDYSPIRLESEKGLDGKPTGKVIGHEAKEGEKDYKPYSSAEAEANPAEQTREVRDRAQREIKPWNVGQARQMIASIRSRFEKAKNEGHVEGETPEQKASNAALIASFIGTVEAAANAWKSSPNVVQAADAKGTSRGKVISSKKQQREADEKIESVKAA